MMKYPHRAADICIEMFPQDSTNDTIRVLKDSLIVERKIDSFYTWFTDIKYVDKVSFKDKIKNIIIASHDTIKITTTKWDDRYKVLYEKKDRDYAILEEKHNKKTKALFWTWLWIAVIGVGSVAYKKYL